MQIFSETCVLALQLQIFFFQWMALGLRPALLWSQRFTDALGLLVPPIGQQRRVQSFAAEQRTKTASRRRSRFGFLQDALFVFRGETTPLGFGNHFGVRRRDRPGVGCCFGCRCTTLRLAKLASLRSAPAKRPGERATPREFPFISAFFFLALLIN